MSGHCPRCRSDEPRLVPAYWSDVRYCPECCELLANEFDKRRTWPKPPWIVRAARETRNRIMRRPVCRYCSTPVNPWAHGDWELCGSGACFDLAVNERKERDK